MNKKKFLILKGSSRNGVLRKFSDEINNAFIQLGHQSELLDLCIGDDQYNLNIIRNYDGDLIVAFGSITAEYQFPDGKYLIESVKTKFLGWLVDDPIYHIPRLILNSKNRKTYACAEHHVDFLKGNGLGGKVSNVLAAGNDNSLRVKKYSERSFDVTFIGSWFGELTDKIEGVEDQNINNWLNKLIAICLKTGVENFYKSAHILANKYTDKFVLDETTVQYLIYAHLHMRKICRMLVVEQIIKNKNLRVHIVGDDWDKNYTCDKNVIFSNNIDSSDIETVMADSKIVLNINAGNGASERAFQAMSVGSCVVSDMSNTLSNYFKAGKEIFFFNYFNINSLNTNIEYLINSNKAENIAINGMAVTYKNHTWINRAIQIVSEIDLDE